MIDKNIQLWNIIDTLNTNKITEFHIMKEEQKKQIEYIIGIDLGHGETSAAICPLQWETPVDQLDPAKDLDMGGNKKVMPSAITILDNGNAYIGDAAFNPEILKQADVHVCFKQAPKDVNGAPEKIMIRFMQEVYKKIRENNKATLTEGNHFVYIATPSGWDRTTQNLYVEMARLAGLPIAGVTKESRAAFVRAQKDVTSGLGRNIDKGSIVFDMGSSTLDFTYMNKNLPGLIDHGYDCGASFIEKSIYTQQKDENEYVQLFAKKYPKLTDYLVFEARKIKEQVYFDPNMKVKKSINFDDFIEDDELEDERFKLAYKPGELNEFLEDNGYINSIENAMLDYKKNFIPNNDIYGVFLTGGASRMDFIIPLVCKCWNVEESQVYRDQDPSLTISQGVAEVARMDLRTEGLDTGLEEKINALINGNQIYSSFVNRFSDVLKQQVASQVADTIIAFKDSNVNYSLNDLEDGISRAVRGTIDEIPDNLVPMMEDTIAEETSDIRATVEDIVANYSSQGINIQKVDFSIQSVDVGNIDLSGMMRGLSNSITQESSNWSGAIAGAAIGGAIAMILGGPLMWMVGGAAWLGSKFFGDSEEEKAAKARARALTQEERIKVYNSIDEKWGDITSKINYSIDSAISSNQQIKNSINSVSRNLLQQYKDNLKSARILID